MYVDFRLRVFLEVASEGSFTRAARRIGITQPAVSQNIADLEREFGITLFERGHGSVALTDRGRTFKAYAERIIREYDELNVIFRHFDEIRALGSIRIAVQDSILPRIASGLIPYARSINPDIVVEIVPLPAVAGLFSETPDSLSEISGSAAVVKASEISIGQDKAARIPDLTIHKSDAGHVEALPSPAFARHPLWLLLRDFLAL